MTFAPVADWVPHVPLAHRGLFGEGIPENSPAAFRAAVDAGIGVELDVRLSRDGIPVVVHDRDLRRSTGTNARVDRLTANELTAQALLGSDDGERIPTLAAVLDLVGGRVPVMVEVKNEAPRAGRMERAVAEVLAGRRGPVVVAGFNPQTVRWFARNAPDVPRCQTGGSSDVVPPGARGALRSMLRRGYGQPDMLSWNVARLDDELLRSARQHGLPVTCWTVRTREHLDHAARTVDNCIFEVLGGPDGVTVEDVRQSFPRKDASRDS